MSATVPPPARTRASRAARSGFGAFGGSGLSAGTNRAWSRQPCAAMARASRVAASPMPSPSLISTTSADTTLASASVRRASASPRSGWEPRSGTVSASSANRVVPRLSRSVVGEAAR